MHWYPSGTVHILLFVWVQMHMWTGYRRVCIAGIVDIQGWLLKRYRLAHYRIPCKQVVFPVVAAGVWSAISFCCHPRLPFFLVVLSH